MKTTIDIPDSLFRRTKARAAMRGESLRDFIVSALRTSLSRETRTEGWKSVFGKASSKAVREVDSMVEAEFSKVDVEDWK
jgi:hypothetical protein